MLCSFLITGKKYIKYKFSKNTFGEDLSSPAPTTVPLYLLRQQGVGIKIKSGQKRGLSIKKELQKGKKPLENNPLSPPLKKK